MHMEQCRSSQNMKERIDPSQNGIHNLNLILVVYNFKPSCITMLKQN